MDCSFQGNCESDLIKHLKITSHQPSQTVEDKRKIFQDYKQCYTCKMDFDGFFNLMNHRKLVHPSNKKCRNFPGSCTFDKDCWYVHDKQTESEENENNFKCDLCKENINGRSSFMKHRKTLHPESVPSCDKFVKGQCSRGSQECWFEHKPSKHIHNSSTSAKQNQDEQKVFQEALGNVFPPDQMKLMLERN